MSERIECLGNILTYKNGMISVSKQGLYKGCDGNMYPYCSVYAEGAGAETIWQILKHLMEVNYERRTNIS